MATTTVPNRNFNATPQTFGPMNLPQKALDEDGINIQLTSNNWNANPGRHLRVFVEDSLDSGTTWRTWNDTTFTTGLFSAKSGALPSMMLRTDDGSGVSLPRQARVTVSAPNGTVNAGAVITF
jgi:hypothetical protein